MLKSASDPASYAHSVLILKKLFVGSTLPNHSLQFCTVLSRYAADVEPTNVHQKLSKQDPNVSFGIFKFLKS